MNTALKVIIILLILLFIIAGFHFYTYAKTKKIYTILQKPIDDIEGYQLYTNTEPLVISFIEDDTFKYNVKNYNLKTALTTEEKYFTINPKANSYLSHTAEICLLRPKEDITLTLINPKSSKFFKSDKGGHNFKFSTLPEKNFSKVNSIDIILHQHNIFCLPRYWLFSVEKEGDVEVFMTHNIFTKIFSIFN